MSPLLFAIAIEPLAAKVRQHYREYALIYPERQILISLYADDLTLYLRDPAVSLNPILRLFTLFGCLSGVNMNWGKSQIFPMTDSTPPFVPDYPLTWCADTITYLEIKISRNREELMRANYGRTLDQLTDKITKWIAMPLSMAARMSLIKMVILPKLLYLYINIPHAPSRHFFNVIKTQMIRLVWGGKQPRMAWEHLTRPNDAGGLEVPDLELFYLCSGPLRGLLDTPPPPPPYMPHLAVENGYMAPTDYLSTTTVPRHHALTTVQCTTGAWRDLAQKLQCPLLYSPLLSLQGRQDLPVTQEEGCCRMLLKLSRLTWGQLYIQGNFCTSEEFFGTTNPTPLERFYYVRLRQDIQTLTPNFPLEPTITSPPPCPPKTILPYTCNITIISHHTKRLGENPRPG